MLIIKECVDISWYLQKYLNLFHLCTDRLLLLLFTVHTMVNSELDSTKSSLYKWLYWTNNKFKKNNRE